MGAGWGTVLRDLLISVAWSLALIVLFVVALLLVLYFSLVGDYDHHFRYTMIDRTQDPSTGLFVELDEVVSMSSFCYEMNIFKTFDDDRFFSGEWSPVATVCGVEGVVARMRFDGTCYVLTSSYRWGGLRTPVWTDPATGRELCFRLLPDPGPKGGWRP